MAGKREKESLASQLIFWAVDWSFLMAFWIALTGEHRASNIAVGAGAALIASILSVLTESLNVARFLPHGRYLWASRSVLWQLPLGVVSVLGVLLRGGADAGRMYFTRFDPGGEDASSQARRAVAESFPTMTPTSVVIGVDRPRRRVLFHLLGTSSPPPSLKRLGEEK